MSANKREAQSDDCSSTPPAGVHAPSEKTSVETQVEQQFALFSLEAKARILANVLHEAEITQPADNDTHMADYDS